MKSKIEYYQIVHTGKEKKIVIEGPLIVQHINRGTQEEGAHYNTLDASIDIYSVKKLQVYNLADNQKIEVHLNYKVYELASSGPVLSVQNEFLHGEFPEISNAIYYISQFEEYGEIVSWGPKNKLSWDNANMVLTIL